MVVQDTGGSLPGSGHVPHDRAGDPGRGVLVPWVERVPCGVLGNRATDRVLGRSGGVLVVRVVLPYSSRPPQVEVTIVQGDPDDEDEEGEE